MRKTTVGTIKADEGGDGYLMLSVDFEKDNPLYRADVLQAVVFEIVQAYNAARRELGWTQVQLTQCDGEDAE